MQLTRSELKEHILHSFTWAIPMGLIIATFVVIFFAISQEIGNIKATQVYLMENVSQLINNNKKQMASDLPLNIGQKATVSKDIEGVKNIKFTSQKVDITGKNYWGFTFENAQQINETKYYIDNGVYVVAYTMLQAPNEGSTTPFELLELNSTQKGFRVNNSFDLNKLVVFVDGKVVIFNDFENNDSSKLKEVLTALSSSKVLPADLKAKALSESKL